MEIANDDIKTYAMDYHGLVAAVCNDLGIAKKTEPSTQVDGSYEGLKIPPNIGSSRLVLNLKIRIFFRFKMVG